MGKQIKFQYNEFDYLIEFDRKTLVRAEKVGFSPEEAVRKPLSQANLLFVFGLSKHHRTLSESKLEDMFDEFLKHYSLDEFVSFCINEYAAFFETTQPNSKIQKKKLEIQEGE